jgi:hypothetical protein
MIKSLIYSLNILFIFLVASYFAKVELEDIMIYTVFISNFLIHLFFINENSSNHSDIRKTS